MSDADWKHPQGEAHVGVLTRDVQIRVLNISVSGGLVETDRRLEVGDLATITVNVDGETYADQCRVVRCRTVPGGSGFRVAVQFLWTAAPKKHSVRRLAKGDTLDVGGHMVTVPQPN